MRWLVLSRRGAMPNQPGRSGDDTSAQRAAERLLDLACSRTIAGTLGEKLQSQLIECPGDPRIQSAGRPSAGARVLLKDCNVQLADERRLAGQHLIQDTSE